MQLEFTYRIEDVREAVQTAIRPGGRTSQSWRPVVAWVLFVLAAAVMFVAVQTASATRPVQQDGPKFDLMLVVIPAAVPGALLVLVLSSSIYRNTRLRPVVSRPQNPQAAAASPMRGAGILGLFIGCLIGLAIWWLTAPGPQILVQLSRPTMVRVAGCISIAELMLLFVYAKLSARLAVRSQWNAKPTWRRAKVMMLNEAGFSLIDSHSRLEYLWIYFLKARETANLLVLHSEDNLIHLIPKRAIPEAELNHARAFIQNGVPNSQFLVKPGGFAVLPKSVLPAERVGK